MKLIADSSTTRTEWALVDGCDIVEHAFTSGLNPFFQTRREISHSVRLELPETFFRRRWRHVYFYGAGCSNKEKKAIIESSLVAQFKTPVTVESDLLGAARAIFGRESGIACILGTGANSGYYNGTLIKDHISPLGYILGDEGSGAVLGRHLIGDVLKHQLPRELCDRFLDEYNLDSAAILRRVYKEPMPNRFLASVTPFLLKNIEEPAIHRLVLNEFKSFFVRNVAQYDNYRNLPVGFVGSIAFHYRNVLEEAAAALDTTISIVLRTPMEGLVRYHSEA